MRRELRAVALGERPAALQALGARGPDPGLSLGVLTAAAIPFFRITQRGYVRVRDGRLVARDL